MSAPVDINPHDPIALAQALVRCPSVTPDEGGALNLLHSIFSAAGFTCYRLPFGGHDDAEAGTDSARVDNLYARWGTAGPHLCFAGHTDVVPPGDAAQWTSPPFAAAIVDDILYGRGVADMKGPLACFVAAALRHLASAPPQGSISFLITGDEEGPAQHGTRRLVKWLEEKGEKIDFCLVGEPTSRAALGDMIKIGRRGTITGYLTVRGREGHVAYPHRADNPIPKMLSLLTALQQMPLDNGSTHFEPSNLEIVTVDTGNTADNVIPHSLRATFNIRFNDLHTGDSITQKIHAALAGATPAVSADDYDLRLRLNGESFYTPPGEDAAILTETIHVVTGRDAELSTSGGTSDARFIRAVAPVIEFGCVGATMHKTDERVAVAELRQLSTIYERFIERWFTAKAKK